MSASGQRMRAAASEKAEMCGWTAISSAGTRLASATPMPKCIGSPVASTTTGLPRRDQMSSSVSDSGEAQLFFSARACVDHRQMALAADDQLGALDQRLQRARQGLDAVLADADDVSQTLMPRLPACRRRAR